MARYEVNLIFSYEVEGVKDKWEALDVAEQMFYADHRHACYNYDINPIGDDEDDDEEEA
jgi:hypothetical protein